MTLNPSAIWDATDAGQNPSKADIVSWANTALIGHDTKSALEAATVPSLVATLRTNGYTTAGDGGGGLYKRVGSEPAHEGKIQSSDGAWWELVPETGVVTTKQFGEVGDGVADDTAAIQNAIDFVYYNQGTTTSAIPTKCMVIGPTCKTTDTIHVGYGTAFKGGIVLSGMGFRRRNEPLNVGTSINPTFTDRPVIAVQGAREVTIQDLWIEGALDLSGVGSTGISPTLEATWDAIVDTERYAPYAGIAIDPYGGTAPGSPYPDVTFPSFLSGPAQYGKNSSSGVTIRNVGMSGLNTGLAVQPANVDSNGDFVKCERVDIEFCKYGISVGNSQSRNVKIIDSNFSNVWRALVGDAHGKQTGQFGGPIVNCSIYAFCYQVFSFSDLTIAGQPRFINLSAESLHEIGNLSGSATTDAPLAFDSCDFNFRHSDTNGHPAAVLRGSTRGAITFTDCAFTGYDSAIVFQPVHTTLPRCTMTPLSSRSKTYEQVFHNAFSGGAVTDTQFPLPSAISFRPIVLSTGSALGASPQITSERYDYTDRNHLWPVHATRASRRGNVFSQSALVDRAFSFTSKTKASFTSVTIGTGASGRLLTLEDSGLVASDILDAHANGCAIRDIDTDTIWIIRSVDTSSNIILAEQQNNYVDDGASGYEPIDDISDSVGSFEFIQTLLFMPAKAIKGDTSSAAATLTNLETTGFGGQTAGGTTAAAQLAAGDWFWSRVDSFTPIAYSASAEIASITSGSNLITMSGNSRDTTTDITFNYWLRDPPSNEASR